MCCLWTSLVWAFIPLHLLRPSGLFALSIVCCFQIKGYCFPLLQAAMDLLANLWCSCIKEPTLKNPQSYFNFPKGIFALSAYHFFFKCFGQVSTKIGQDDTGVSFTPTLPQRQRTVFTCLKVIFLLSWPYILTLLLWDGVFQYLTMQSPNASYLRNRPWGSSDK